MNRRNLLGFIAALAAIAIAPSRYEISVFAPLPGNAAVSRVVVRKSLRELTLYQASTPLKTYRIALGPVPVGPKRAEGDQRTPEGSYTVDSRLLQSAFHRALHVSYPDEDDVAAAAEQGRPPGGAIMIHGLPNGLGVVGPLHRLFDWSAGCMAVTNREIEEIWRVVPDGTPIEIVP